MEDEQLDDQQGRPRGRRPHSVWKVIGISVGVVAALFGLGYVAFIAWIAIAFSSYGSNK